MSEEAKVEKVAAPKKPAKKSAPAAKKSIKKAAAPEKAKVMPEIDETPAVAPKAKADPAPTKRAKYNPHDKIRVVVAENPYRKGTVAYEVFRFMKKCKTVRAFRNSEFGLSNATRGLLSYGVRDKYYEIDPA